jgi:hypothetical protein
MLGDHIVQFQKVSFRHMPIVSSRASSEAGWKWKWNFLTLYIMITEPLVFISVGVTMNAMCHGPVDIGIYIVQTDSRSLPFIVRFWWERETRGTRFWFFGPMHGLYWATRTHDTCLEYVTGAILSLQTKACLGGISKTVFDTRGAMPQQIPFGLFRSVRGLCASPTSSRSRTS